MSQLMQICQEEAKVECRRLMDQYGLHDWSFEWHKSIGRLGLCNYKEKRISLSSWQPDGCFQNTIRHEIAHALTPGAGHGAIWQHMCRRVGAKPETCRDVELPDHIGYRQFCSGCKSIIGQSIRPRRSLKKWRSVCCKAVIYQRRPLGCVSVVEL